MLLISIQRVPVMLRLKRRAASSTSLPLHIGVSAPGLTLRARCCSPEAAWALPSAKLAYQARFSYKTVKLHTPLGLDRAAISSTTGVRHTNLPSFIVTGLWVPTPSLLLQSYLTVLVIAKLRSCTCQHARC